MKKTYLICGLIAANITSGFAQSQQDELIVATRALRLASSEPVLGTARYTGMAGAMGALGGDGSAFRDNAAALGIYRKTDIGLTPNVNIDNEGNGNFNFNNFSAIFNLGKKNASTGYITSSFGIAYNRIANFNRSTYTAGVTSNDYDYTNKFYEDNGSGVWNFGYGLNIGNKVYAGLSVNAFQVSYKQITYNNTDNLDFENRFETDGSGCNLNFGLIVRPTDAVRIGASFTTPTWMTLEESYEHPVFDNYGYPFAVEDTYGNPYYQYIGYGFDHSQPQEYKIQSPLKADLSLGFILGKRALIGVDYAYQNFNSMKVKDIDKHEYRDVKKVIDDNYKGQHTVKLGTEIQIAKGFAARAGFAHQTSPTEDECNEGNRRGLYVPYGRDCNAFSFAIPKSANYITLGAGYHGKAFYCDLAYMNKQQKEDFYEWQEALYNDNDEIVDWGVDPIKHTLKTHNVMLTLGVKF